MSKRTFAPATLVLAACTLVFAAVLGATHAGAQDTATPPVGAATAETVIALHPAHIHTGSCDEVGDVVYPLNDLQAASRVISPVASPGVALTPATPDLAVGAETLPVVAQSGTSVEASLADLIDGGYVINVHQSAEQMQNYLACGEITGTPADGRLDIDLVEVNDSGYAGEAILIDNGDNTTAVDVSLFPAEIVGTPVATPSS